jgi:DNA polymerase-3 subunit gamma/tau
MDQLVSFSGNEIRGEEVARLLGMVESDLLAAITAAILAGDASAAIDRVSVALSEGYSVDELMDAFMSFLRNLLLVTAGASESLREVPESELKHLRQLSADLPDIAVLNVLRIISGAAAEIKRSNLPRITLETAVMTASKLSRAFDLHQLPGIARNLSSSAVGRTAADPEEEPAPGNGVDDPVEDDLGEEAPETLMGSEDAGKAEIEDTSLEEHPREPEPETVPDTVNDEPAHEPEPHESHADHSDDENKGQEKTGDDEADREKEKETSQEILGLFDAV